MTPEQLRKRFAGRQPRLLPGALSLTEAFNRYATILDVLVTGLGIDESRVTAKVLSMIEACNGHMTIRDILVTGLEIEESRITVSDSRWVGRILRANGWKSWETHNHRIYWRKQRIDAATFA